MKTRIISLIILVLIGTTAFSQFRISKVSSNMNTGPEGVVYGLPRTVIQLDISMQKIDKIPGPLADYATEYLGVSDYINKLSSTYKLLNVNVITFPEIDPDNSFYLQFAEQRGKDDPENAFHLSDIGTLISFNAKSEFENQPKLISNINQTYQVYNDGNAFDYNAGYNRKKVIDTIIRKINIDTVSIDRFTYRTNWANLTEKDKANEAALKIQSIREQRFNLLTGFQEVNYGGSIIYMDNELKKMENDYLQLFLGKELSSVEHYTVFVIAKEGEEKRKVLTTENGDNIEIVFTKHGNTSLLPEKPVQKENHLFYRVPENTTVEIDYNGKTFKTVSFPICQFGKLLMAPLNNTQLYFDPNTGNLLRIVKK